MRKDKAEIEIINGKVKYPVKYHYYGNIHRRVNHGGIVCAATVINENNDAYVGYALCSNTWAETLDLRKKDETYKPYNKQLLREIAYTRLHFALMGSFPDADSIVNKYDSRSETYHYYSSYLEAMQNPNRCFVISDWKKEFRRRFSSSEFFQTLRLADLVKDYIDGYCNNHSKNMLPSWVLGCHESCDYTHIDSQRAQDYSDLHDDANQLLESMSEAEISYLPTSLKVEKENTNITDFIIDSDSDANLDTYCTSRTVVYAKTSDIHEYYGVNAFVNSDKYESCKNAGYCLCLGTAVTNSSNVIIKFRPESKWSDFSLMENVVSDYNVVKNILAKNTEMISLRNIMDGSAKADSSGESESCKESLSKLKEMLEKKNCD